MSNARSLKIRYSVFVINSHNSTKEIKIILENANVVCYLFYGLCVASSCEYKFPARATFNVRSVCKGAEAQFNPI